VTDRRHADATLVTCALRYGLCAFLTASCRHTACQHDELDDEETIKKEISNLEIEAELYVDASDTAIDSVRERDGWANARVVDDDFANDATGSPAAAAAAPAVAVAVVTPQKSRGAARQPTVAPPLSKADVTARVRVNALGACACGDVATCANGSDSSTFAVARVSSEHLNGQRAGHALGGCSELHSSTGGDGSVDGESLSGAGSQDGEGVATPNGRPRRSSRDAPFDGAVAPEYDKTPNRAKSAPRQASDRGTKSCRAALPCAAAGGPRPPPPPPPPPPPCACQMQHADYLTP
jgi:hypothetical protein